MQTYFSPLAIPFTCGCELELILEFDAGMTTPSHTFMCFYFSVDMADGISDGRAHLNYPAPLLDMAVEYTPTPPDQPRRPPKEMQQQQSSGKENMWNASVEPPDIGESDLQEHSQRNSHRVRPVNGKRPEWNMRQPSRPFVPASKRYPAGLRQHRQESRLRRQMELLTLVEKNASSRTQAQLAQEVPPSTCLHVKVWERS